jgi:2-oxoglutarate ferredoxin oxidoreductase subunit alpha
MATATHLLTPEEAHADLVPENVVVRFAGDSGDGMQLTGGQFTLSTALAGNDLATFPDFPAEIRAPQGTTFGVSAFQINFGSASIETAGDQPDVLVAMNPAALKVNVAALRDGGMIIADEGEFSPVTSLRRVTTPIRWKTAASPAGSWSSSTSRS